MARHDLSDWLIHFVHKSTTEHLPDEFDEDFEIPDFFVSPLNRLNEDDEFGAITMWRDGYGQPFNGFYSAEDAFSALKKILSDGFIKSTWSFRGGKATIYGDKSTVCLTEMPLYALIEYAKSRESDTNVSPYGLGFLKREMYNASVRPVIYGLTGDYKEAEKDDPHYQAGPRCLAVTCNIGIPEQYRYVTYDPGRRIPIDWTHEREWRWAGIYSDIHGKMDVPGLPLYSDLEDCLFSKIIIIVKTQSEVSEIINLLTALHDSGGNNYYEFENNIFYNIHVVALDDLVDLENFPVIRLDDLPTAQLPKIEIVNPTQETLTKVPIVLQKAGKIWEKAAKDQEKIQPKGSKGIPIGLCGFGRIMTYQSNTEVTQALLKLGIAHSIPEEEGYMIFDVGNCHHSQNVDINFAGAAAAAAFLSKEFGQKFHAVSKLD